MKKLRLYTLLALLLMAGGVTMQAQEPQRFFERHYIDDLIFMNENDLLVLGADEAADVALTKRRMSPFTKWMKTENLSIWLFFRASRTIIV